MRTLGIDSQKRVEDQEHALETVPPPFEDGVVLGRRPHAVVRSLRQECQSSASWNRISLSFVRSSFSCDLDPTIFAVDDLEEFAASPRRPCGLDP